MSSLLGASLLNKDRLYFCVLGDLAFFYDMNSVGNRHLGNNVRILLVNNGKGTEFRHKSHRASILGEAADEYIAAAGHFGGKSEVLVKHYAESLGFEYMQASTKGDFLKQAERFLVHEVTDRPMLFEVFTESDEETKALYEIMHLGESLKGKSKQIVKQVLGEKRLNVLKKVIRR